MLSGSLAEEVLQSIKAAVQSYMSVQQRAAGRTASLAATPGCKTAAAAFLQQQASMLN
jgi:hypothetical protein